MPATLIQLGGIGNPAQETITAGGDYDVAIAALTPNPTVTFSGPAVFNVDNVAGLLTGYTFEAANGATLNINGLATAASTANLVVSGASTIVLNSGINALSIVNTSFVGTGGTLSFAPSLLSALATAPTISGFGVGDHINFGTALVAGEQAVYTAATGLLSLETAGGVVVGSVRLAGTYQPSAFSVGVNAAGQAEIDFACFLRGTLIRTPQGDVAVEKLATGDQVTTASGAAVPVKAVRMRSFDGSLEQGSGVQPICILQGALGANVPARDLFVSPDHSMYLDGVLVPASLLQNGRSIFQANRSGTIEYFHVEVEPHAILFAEDAATESYLDIGNRNHFLRSDSVTLLPSADPLTWEDACAPLVLRGPVLDRIRARLAGRVAACLDGTSEPLETAA